MRLATEAATSGCWTRFHTTPSCPQTDSRMQKPEGLRYADTNALMNRMDVRGRKNGIRVGRGNQNYKSRPDQAEHCGHEPHKAAAAQEVPRKERTLDESSPHGGTPDTMPATSLHSRSWRNRLDLSSRRSPRRYCERSRVQGMAGANRPPGQTKLQSQDFGANISKAALFRKIALFPQDFRQQIPDRLGNVGIFR